MTTERRLDVLGAPMLAAAGAATILRTRKAVALLVYLALQPDRCARRETVATLLWPRVGSEAARTSLRQLLAALRKAGGEAPLIDSQGDMLTLAPDVAVDAARFRALAASGTTADAVAATDLYRADLLADGLSIDSPDFDDWLDGARADLRRVAVDVLQRLAEAGQFGTVAADIGLRAAERAAELDPYNERAHRALMRLQVASRRPDLALRHYAALRALLARELQVDPEAETRALHERIRSERRAPPPDAPSAAGAPPPPGDPVPPSETPTTPAERAPSVLKATRRPGRRAAILICIAIVAVAGLAAWLAGRRATAPAPPTVARLFRVASDPALEQRPAIAPDGGRVVYTARLHDRRNVDLYLANIGDQTPIRLTTDREIDDNAVWTPDGAAIAFTRSSRDGRSPCRILVMAVPGGQERVAGRCRHAIASRLSWAPDGRTLFYSDRETPDGLYRIYRLDTATGSVAAVTHPPASIVGDGEPQVSRDGTRLAFLRTQAWQSVEVMIRDLATGDERSLTHDGKTVWGLTWADDRGLIFSSDRTDDTGLWWIAADGTGLSRLALGDGEYRSLSHARDRKRLVFESLRDRASFYALPAGATPAYRPTPIENLRTNLFDRFYTRSRQGRAAFVSTRSGSEELWVADGGGAPHQITRAGDTFYQEPDWSPDGRWIAFVGVVGGRSDLYLISGDGGAVRRLTDDEAPQQSPQWSADGRSLYFTSRRSGAWQIWRMPAFADGTPVAVSGNGPRTVRPGPDGRDLYYIVEGQPGIRRRRLGLDGRLTGAEDVVIADLHPNDWNNWWLADGAIFYARRGGGDPSGMIVRVDLATRAARPVTDATDLLWSASFWANPDGSLVLTRRDLQIDLAGIDF